MASNEGLVETKGLDPSVVTNSQMSLITKTIAADATDEELQLFLYDCKRRGVHPLDGLIRFTKAGGKYTPITTVDFLRRRAAQTGQCAGIDDALFLGEKATPDWSATVTVKRMMSNGTIAEFTATARWEEYYPVHGFSGMWDKMPHTMLGKCAEALALRKGFPEETGGLYTYEEMNQGNVYEPGHDEPKQAGYSQPKAAPSNAPKKPSSNGGAPPPKPPQSGDVATVEGVLKKIEVRTTKAGKKMHVYEVDGIEQYEFTTFFGKLVKECDELVGKPVKLTAVSTTYKGPTGKLGWGIQNVELGAWDDEPGSFDE